MKGQKALLLGGLVAALALGSAVGALAETDKDGHKGLLAQAPDVPGLGDDKPADKPAAAPKAPTAFIVTRQDGTKVQGRIHDAGDSIVVDTPEGPVSIPKADVSAIRNAPVEAPPPPADVPPADKPPADKPPADKPPETPPADKPPADKPPADMPPADKPPADKPPETPPADKPPADKPPETPPADKPPADKPPETPPADKPPADKPPETPPADKPPADKPPADKPPETPPADKPPADKPPADKPPADKPPETPPADKPPADKPPADKPPAGDGSQPDALAPTEGPSSARAVDRPLYPAEESEFGPVSVDHRGPVELSPYLGWSFISHGIGISSGGMLALGTRATFNFGDNKEYGVDLDWKFSRPDMLYASQVSDSAGNQGEVKARTADTIETVALSFTYRLRQLRVEYLTPYVSAGMGVMVFDGVAKKVTLSNTVVRIHESITPAPAINLGAGLDYKLDPTFSLRLDLRDEIFFTSYNSNKGGTQVLNALTVSFGVVVAFD
jgi:hypothetical protein